MLSVCLDHYIPYIIGKKCHEDMLTKSWLKVWNFLGMKENKEDIKLLLIMAFAGEKTSVITLN